MSKNNRAIDRFVKLDVYDFDYNNIEKWKANVLQKGVGFQMIFRIMEHFNINLVELREKQEQVFKEELKFQENLKT